MLREGHELVVHASAGHVQDMQGKRLPIAGSTSGQVLERGRRSGSPTSTPACGSLRASSGSPTRTRRCWCRWSTAARRWGCWRRSTAVSDGNMFGEDDEQVLRTFAASAATAVAMAQSVQADRLRSSLAAADAERRRWARELHDETLQGLGGLRRAAVLGAAP